MLSTRSTSSCQFSGPLARRFIWPLLAALTTACGTARHDTGHVKFDSASSVALDATVVDGVMLTTEPNYGIDSQIKDQLYFTIGLLNGWNGVADLANRSVNVKSIVALPGPGRLSKVTYDASFRVSWFRNYQIPSSFVAPVPARGDYQGIQAFYSKYEGACVEDRHEIGFGNFWYYFRPMMGGCPLAARSGQEDLTYLLKVNTTLSRTNTQGKYPEYAKIWEDHQLVATAVFGKYVSGGAADDIGVGAYNQMYQMLLQNFGNPSQSNVSLGRGEVPGLEHPDVRLVFDTRQGKVDVNILLVDSLGSVSTTWREHFNERTATSDFISYNGHAGLGSNIRALSQMGRFTPNQFHLYYVNSCDTYSYLGKELAESHRATNPGSLPSRFLDTITNSMPSPFSAMASSTDAILMALFRKQYTYREILSTINSGQNPNVTGEEDNRWPQSF
jgi:hypothetical protein